MNQFLTVRARALVLLGRAVLELAAFILLFTVMTLTYCLGIGWFILAPTVGACRKLANMARRQARDWSGVSIPAPYAPGPPKPVRQTDGWYRLGRNLYRNPWYPAYHLRTVWIYIDAATWRDFLWTLVDPMVSAMLALLSLVFGAKALRWHARWSTVLLAPTRRAQLNQRVQRLTQIRAETNDSQAAELRRIERDLHDGTQARLVALGMTMGAAEKLVDEDPTAAKALLAKAQVASGQALTELRELVQGIYPPVLAERGLVDAVQALALDTPLNVEVRAEFASRLPAPMESVLYFAVSELLTNVSKHASATEVYIHLREESAKLVLSVTDNGSGGADIRQGGGLQGIERRLAAFDGVVTVNSPQGGPTAVTIELPSAGQDFWESKFHSVSRADLMGLLYITFGSILLWPQGIVAAIIKLKGEQKTPWFLALNLPSAFQWPAIVIMIGLGVIGYTRAFTYFRNRLADTD